MKLRHILVLTGCAFAVSAQQAAPSIQITGAVKQPLTVSAEDLAKMPRARVTTGSGGTAVVYEGVRLRALLDRAGVPGGAELRGPALASYLVAEAKDGYQVVFSLAEIDPAFTDKDVLVADRADGKPLAGPIGPFRLVAPGEKRAARSVRMLTRLEVVMLSK